MTPELIAKAIRVALQCIYTKEIDDEGRDYTSGVSIEGIEDVEAAVLKVLHKAETFTRPENV